MNEESENPQKPDPMSGSPDPAEPARAVTDLAGMPSRRATDVHPLKRKLVTALIALYAISVIAAGAVLWRSQTERQAQKAEDGGGGLDLDAGKGILSAVQKKDSVGYVAISGPIYRSHGGQMFEKGVQQWGRRIEKLAKKSEVKAIVLAIDSPGGSVGAVQELHSIILRVRKEHGKPIVAHLGDVAASGGYYLAAACDKVVAHPGSLVGSIGVIFSMANLEDLFKKVGVQTRVIKSGKMKDIGSMARPMTEEEKKLLQDLIDDTYGQFLKAVVDGRKMSEEKVRPLADGRIFSGRQSLDNGLVDELGDTHHAVVIAARLGGIKDEKPKVYQDTQSLSSFLELFESKLSFMRSPELGLLREVRQWGYTGLEYRWRN